MKTRKLVKILAIVALFCGLMVPASYAAKDGPFDKLSRGLVSIVSSPGEYLVQFELAQEKRPNHWLNFPKTAMTGTLAMASRVAIGAYDIVTFPFPMWTGYGPVMEPETTLDAAIPS